MEKLDYDNAMSAITDIKTEAEANMTSGDMSINSQARRIWIVADILHTFLTAIPANSFNKPGE